MATKLAANSLNLVVGQPPMVRLRGDIRRMNFRALTRTDLEKLLNPMMNENTAQHLEKNGSVDFSYAVGPDESIFRCRVSHQQGELSLYARPIESADEGLPE
jgi:twitching motility protein PilT